MPIDESGPSSYRKSLQSGNRYGLRGIPTSSPAPRPPAESPRWKIRPRVIFPLLAILLITGALSWRFSGNFTHAAPAGGSVTFPGTVSPIIKRSHLQGQADPNQQISLSIGLRLSNADGLKHYVEDITNPKSLNYHRYLTPAQVSDVFGPDKATYNALLQFLQQSGFTIKATYRHRLLITFSGTVGQVESVFHVQINNYTAPGGHQFYANPGDPQLPATLAGAVLSISGLNNALHWQHASLDEKNLPSNPQGASVTCLGHGNNYLTPDQTASAYNLNGLYSAGYSGEGQTVALFELDTYQMSDLTNYASCFGHAHPAIQTVVTGSNPVPTDDGVAEVELDAELVLSAAPQLGILRIYEAANDESDYNAEWAQIVQDAVPVVSTSWGACENDIGQQEAQQENAFFMEAVAQGQNIFAASGDSGSAGCYFDGSSSSILNAGDPGAQPFVTGVGGTSLTLNGPSYGSETTWNNSYGASGGGISQFWQSPTWQIAPGVINSYTSGAPCNAPQGSFCRETPDVSLNADPTTGYLIYCTSPAVSYCKNNGPWVVIGGTSAAAPMWAAMMTLTNEMSLKTGGFNLGFVAPLLYQVGNNQSSYSASFHDITSGNNDYNNLNGGVYPATANYDMATGLGSYNAFTLASNLVSLALNQSGSRSAPASRTWYFAEGSVGGSFQEFLTLENPNTSQAATVSVTYLFQSRSSVTITHTVPASSRFTVNVNSDLNIPPSASHQSISAVVQVTSGPAIIAERPMYFNFQGIQSGTDVLGATAPGQSFFFSYADTRQSGRSYYSYITMLNPSSTQTATATITYYTGSCGRNGQPSCPQQVISIPPLHRGTGAPPANSQVSVYVTSNLPIVVERPMYFRDTVPNAGGLTTGAASVVGVPVPGNDWLFAEGYTAKDFQEYFELANFDSSTPATATIKLEYSNGHTQAIQVTVPPLGRYVLDVNQANAHPYGTCDVNPCQTTNDSSAEITSTGPIVADRLMYFHFGPHYYSGGTEAIGEAGLSSHNAYAFAEGYTANNFTEFLTLQNPTNADETVAVTMFADTYVIQQQLVVKAHSRHTLDINNYIVPIAQSHDNGGANAYAVSIIVQSLGNGTTIVVERPMYFDFYGDQGGTDVIGFTG
ncbi:MAG TPA: S53 family peptidase [Ktedonobacteraceae bacterium]|nr:S53 family peptidase [Ktedonobacteraceae bacterium]